MMDLHDRFDDWIVEGAEGEPSRDLAVHASGCDACLRSLAAVDSLQAIDISAASLPPLGMVAPAATDSLARRLRYAAGAVAVVLLGTSVAIGASGLLRRTQLGSDQETPSPGEGVLAGVPSAPATSQPVSEQPTASASDSEKPKQSASEESAVAVATAIPFQVLPHGTPFPPPPGAPQQTPAPTAAPTAAPIVTPSPTSSSASPSLGVPTPTLEPTPTTDPSPSSDPSPLP